MRDTYKTQTTGALVVLLAVVEGGGISVDAMVRVWSVRYGESLWMFWGLERFKGKVLYMYFVMSVENE